MPPGFEHEDGGRYSGEWRGRNKHGAGCYTYPPPDACIRTYTGYYGAGDTLELRETGTSIGWLKRVSLGTGDIDCSACTYLIGVHAAQHDAEYAVTAATATSIVVLENGVPHPGQLAAAQVGSYRLYVPAGGVTGVRVTLTPLSGDVAMYMSTTSHRPNESHLHSDRVGF